jgi:hypothetical protein
MELTQPALVTSSGVAEVRHLPVPQGHDRRAGQNVHAVAAPMRPAAADPVPT